MARIKWKQVALDAQAQLNEEGLDLVMAFFKGMLDSKEFISDKDSAKELEKQFAASTIDEFIEEMAHEMETFEPDEDSDQYDASMQRKQIASGAGVLTKEFFLYKLKQGKANTKRTHK